MGVGLIGGSLGLALRERGIAKTVVGIGRNPKRLALAKRKGAVDSVTINWKEGISCADLVVICTPVSQIIPIVKELQKYFSANCIVTDVGSTKKAIVEGNENILRKRSKDNIYFIGSHPMAGSEQFGIEAARKDLYMGSLCMVTPTKRSHLQAVNKLKKMWKAIGCNVIEITPDSHDKCVAAVSHLPHVLASALVNTIFRLDKNTDTTQPN